MKVVLRLYEDTLNLRPDLIDLDTYSIASECSYVDMRSDEYIPLEFRTDAFETVPKLDTLEIFALDALHAYQIWLAWKRNDYTTQTINE